MHRPRRDDDTPSPQIKRERFYECVFVADRNEYRFHLRAWTPEEAAEHLRTELDENGVSIPGEIRVMDRQKVLLTLDFSPRQPLG